MPNLKQKIDLLRGLINGETNKGSPFDVDIDLTTRCNLRCVGCPFHSPLLRSQDRPPVRQDLDPDVFTTLCRDLKEMGTRYMIMSGSGEPLMHPQFFKMVEIAKKHDFHSTLSTNGTLINEKNARALVESGLDTIRVSLWASTQEEYMANYPDAPSGSFEKVIDGFRYLSRIKGEGFQNPQIILYNILNKHNIHRIPVMVDLASNLGCDGLWFSPMYNMEGLMTEHIFDPERMKNIVRDLKEARKQLRRLGLEENIHWALKRYKAKRSLWAYQSCYVSWYHIRVNASGTVIPCGRCRNNFHHGNLHEKSIGEIWNGPEIRQFRRMILSREGRSLLRENCDCSMCCFFYDLHRIHRIYRWVSWIPKKKVPKVH